MVTAEVLAKSRKKYFFEINERLAIDGSSRGNIARYINHSCRPNAQAFVSRRGRIWIWLKRGIEAGEEITLDYGREYVDDYILPKGCRCRSCTVRPRRAKTDASSMARQMKGGKAAILGGHII